MDGLFRGIWSQSLLFPAFIVVSQSSFISSYSNCEISTFASPFVSFLSACSSFLVRMLTVWRQTSCSLLLDRHNTWRMSESLLSYGVADLRDNTFWGLLFLPPSSIFSSKLILSFYEKKNDGFWHSRSIWRYQYCSGDQENRINCSNDKNNKQKTKHNTTKLSRDPATVQVRHVPYCSLKDGCVSW